jgi:methionine sulfoxide reductase heme-binding subunit
MDALTQLTGPSALWYFTRSTGAVAMLLLTASVVLGVLSGIGWRSARWPRFLSSSLHRNISLFVLILLVLHIVTAVLDGFAPIRLTDSVIPFVSPYRPLWLGLGTLSFDIICAVILTSLVRRWIGFSAWRLIHWLSYLAWPVALVHGLGTGTDTPTVWMLALYIVCVVAVVIAIVWRVTAGWPATAPSGLRLACAAATGACAAGIGIWFFQGPLEPGWASRAGTALLTSSASASTKQGSGGSADSLPAVPFTANLTGTLESSADSTPGVETVTLDSTLTGANDRVHLTLQGQPQEDGGINMTSGSTSFGPSTQPSLYQGPVLELSGNRLVTSVKSPGKQPLLLTLDLQTDPTSNAVSGTASVRADR